MKQINQTFGDIDLFDPFGIGKATTNFMQETFEHTMGQVSGLMTSGSFPSSDSSKNHSTKTNIYNSLFNIIIDKK